MSCVADQPEPHCCPAVGSQSTPLRPQAAGLAADISEKSGVSRPTYTAESTHLSQRAPSKARCFCCFCRKLSATDPFSSAGIPEFGRRSDRKNSEMTAFWDHGIICCYNLTYIASCQSINAESSNNGSDTAVPVGSSGPRSPVGPLPMVPAGSLGENPSAFCHTRPTHCLFLSPPLTGSCNKNWGFNYYRNHAIRGHG
jgi:hypothetical protein